MEGCCSFKSLIGGVCGYNIRDRKCKTEIVPLLSCTNNVSSHKSAFKCTGPEGEIDLILCRASMFTYKERLSTVTICPNHRAKLGLGWTRRSSTRCRVRKEFPAMAKGKECGQKVKEDWVKRNLR